MTQEEKKLVEMFEHVKCQAELGLEWLKGNKNEETEKAITKLEELTAQLHEVAYQAKKTNSPKPQFGFTINVDDLKHKHIASHEDVATFFNIINKLLAQGKEINIAYLAFNTTDLHDHD